MKRWGKEILVLGLATMVAMLLGIPSGEAATKEKGVLVVAGVPSVINLDPASSGSSINVMMYRDIFQGLTRYKFNTTELEGDLARSWSASKDGLVYTFKLRDNVLWHKGFGKVTAQDVKFSIDRILDPNTRSQFLGDLNMIKEAKVIDDLTVEIHLKSRDVTFLNKCVVRPMAILSQKAVEKYGKDLGRNPIGSGPYVLDSMSREETVLIANKGYFEGAPKIEKVIYKAIPDIDTMVMALTKGEIDLIHGLFLDKTYFDRIKAAGCIPKGVDVGSSYVLLINPKVEPLGDIRVRRAMAYAIDRNELISHLFIPGTADGLDVPVPKGYWGHTTEGLARYSFDPKKAKELLTEAGYPNGFDAILDTSNLNSYLPIATAIQDQLTRAGIRVKLDVSDEASWQKKVASGTARMTLFFHARIPDADGTLTRLYHGSSAPPGWNLALYNKVDKEIEEARGELNPARRLKMYQDIQRKAMEDLPLIPLFQTQFGLAYRSNVAGVPDQDPTYGPDFYHLYFRE